MNISLKHLLVRFPGFARVVKQVGVYPRYILQANSCQSNYKTYGANYSQNIIFIAGLPKSGTTWLKKMLTCYPGFSEIIIPDATSYELRTGGSHDYDLPIDIFNRFEKMLVISKMHLHGSLHNIEVLHSANIKYAILYRDLRDVAISYYFYVRQTPWHPEYPDYANINITDGLILFSQQLLTAYENWIRSWHKNRDPASSIIIRYEQLLDDTLQALTHIADHFDLDRSPETIKGILDQTSFRKMSGGRQSGQAATDNFVRKGIQGDWANYFTPEVKNLYKQKIGKFLVDYGYEQDLSW